MRKVLGAESGVKGWWVLAFPFFRATEGQPSKTDMVVPLADIIQMPFGMPPERPRVARRELSGPCGVVLETMRRG